MPRRRAVRGSAAPFGGAGWTRGGRACLPSRRPRNVRAVCSAPQVRATRCGSARRVRRAGRIGARAILATVSTLDALARELQATWLREIPLAATMAVEVASCTREELAVRAPLAPNRNLHGTAFAGSLFSLCALTAWGAVWLALRRRGLDGVLVLADSRIRFRRAVSGELVCRCRPDLAAVERSLAGFDATQRTIFTLVSTIDQDDKNAVTFNGEYVVHSKNQPHARD